ncbi:MAG: hypothetical protein Q8922_16035 [Bacteroidota bacterium]|nr:hypothetical protein [Bacteroidota bacterium]MDP4233081.1 hypothetical protein [Bacteroidota bacterium]MDP4241774.1 hypothetical protein [Bacteroidota bacterium]MDP4289424.1 hypothetical protein [Bacteroidota bacterium]
MYRFETVRAFLIAVLVVGFTTSTALAQGWRVPAADGGLQKLNLQPTTALSGQILELPELGEFMRDRNVQSMALPELDRFKLLPPAQVGTPGDIPHVEIPPIDLDTALIFSQPDLTISESDGPVFGAKGDVIHGHIVVRDNGILLKGWDHDLDPGIVWSGQTTNSLACIHFDPDSLIGGNAVFISDGHPAVGALRSSWPRVPVIAGPLTLDTVMSEGDTLSGNISSGFVPLGEVFGFGGQKHDHYYLKDGTRYYMQYTWPGPNAPKMEERAGKSNTWLIGEPGK